ncbi:MAG: His-Xaa-Ser system radical SAM maturase HxsC [Elusimicrobia bacterium]|nr:His-Xaa-Ser system radical SAM maturase HxsC [Elusimicrobiota bacterium]
MKQLKGYPQNIQNQIVGKIKYYDGSFIYPSKTILISDRIPKIPFGINCILTDKYIKGKYNVPTIDRIQSVADLHNNDIVLIEKNGNINIVYEHGKDDNVLLMTERCNASCIMCPQHQESINQGSYDLLNRQILALLPKEIKYLGITGGEPTLYKEHLIKYLSFIKDRLPNTVVALLTNGILLEDINFVEDILEIGNSKLIFQIPLYSDIDLIHNKIMGVASYFRTIKGIYNLATYGQNIEIRVVVQKLNYERLSSIARFIYRNMPFVAHVAFMAVELESLAKNNIEEIWVNPVDEIYQDELYKGIKYLYNRNLEVSIYNLPLCLIKKEYWGFYKKSISSWKKVFSNKCNNCHNKENCGGFFKSTLYKMEKYIQPFTVEEVLC